MVPVLAVVTSYGLARQWRTACVWRACWRCLPAINPQKAAAGLETATYEGLKQLMVAQLQAVRLLIWQMSSGRRVSLQDMAPIGTLLSPLPPLPQPH